MKPIIGITGNFIDNDIFFMNQGLGAKGQEWTVLSNDYVKAVVRAGGIPVIVPVETDREYLESIGDMIDGLILSGGEDVDPMLYGKIPDRRTGRISPKRDESELYLINYVFKNTNKPILAVCRGLQILNVYMKGTLILDVPDAGFNEHSIGINDRFNPVHNVILDENSLLYKLVGDKEIGVNSLHHQGINKLGNQLKVVGKSGDNLIEAVEYENIDERFIMGLQWHPEMISIRDSRQRHIFDYFINEAKKIKEQR